MTPNQRSLFVVVTYVAGTLLLVGVVVPLLLAGNIPLWVVMTALVAYILWKDLR